MFEIGDIVMFRSWTGKPWEEGTWIIIDQELTAEVYDSKFYSYTIQNQETGEIQLEVNWQQIESI